VLYTGVSGKEKDIPRTLRARVCAHVHSLLALAQLLRSPTAKGARARFCCTPTQAQMLLNYTQTSFIAPQLITFNAERKRSCGEGLFFLCQTDMRGGNGAGIEPLDQTRTSQLQGFL
jgi:hypothetical protein